MRNTIMNNTSMDVSVAMNKHLVYNIENANGFVC